MAFGFTGPLLDARTKMTLSIEISFSLGVSSKLVADIEDVRVPRSSPFIHAAYY
jgi:hypothetical protein